MNNHNHIKGVEYVMRRWKGDCSNIQFGEGYCHYTQRKMRR